MIKSIYKYLYAQVLRAIVCGVLLGHFYPAVGIKLQPLADGFIKLIKMLIAPIIFCTVVAGIANAENMKKVGRRTRILSLIHIGDHDAQGLLDCSC